MGCLGTSMSHPKGGFVFHPFTRLHMLGHWAPISPVAFEGTPHFENPLVPRDRRLARTQRESPALAQKTCGRFLPMDLPTRCWCNRQGMRNGTTPKKKHPSFQLEFASGSFPFPTEHQQVAEGSFPILSRKSCPFGNLAIRGAMQHD